MWEIWDDEDRELATCSAASSCSAPAIKQKSMVKQEEQKSGKKTGGICSSRGSLKQEIKQEQTGGICSSRGTRKRRITEQNFELPMPPLPLQSAALYGVSVVRLSCQAACACNSQITTSARALSCACSQLANRKRQWPASWCVANVSGVLSVLQSPPQDVAVVAPRPAV